MMNTALLAFSGSSPDFSLPFWISAIGAILLSIVINNAIRNLLVRIYKLEDVFPPFEGGWEIFERFTYYSIGFYISCSLSVLYMLLGYIRIWKAHPTWFQSTFGLCAITFGLILVLFVVVQTITTFIGLTLGKGIAVAAKKISESKAGQAAGQKIQSHRQQKLEAKQQQLGLTTSLADRFGGARNAQPQQAQQPPQNPQAAQPPQYPQNAQAPQYPQNAQAPQYPQNAQAPQYPQNAQAPQYPQNAQVPQYPQNAQVPQYPQNAQVPQYPQNAQAPQYPQNQQPPQQ